MAQAIVGKDSRFWDRIAARYARQPVVDEESYQRKLRVTRDYLHRDMEVLEIGCGTGSTAIALAPSVKHIRAVDISANMIVIAKEKAVAAGVANVAFEQAEIESFDAPDASFDAVFAHSILHLVPDRDRVIGKMYRLLKPGGIFVSSTICMSGGFAFWRSVLPLGRAIGFLPLVRFFSREALEDSIKAAGFAIDHAWQPRPKQAVFLIARKPG